MKILVTGGAGFIGSQVVDAYLAAGHEVAVIDNFTSGSRDNLNPQAKLYEIDIEDAAAVQQAIADFKPEIINHHAAQIDVRVSVSDPLLDARRNIIGSLNLIEAAREAGIHKFIYANSGGASYGDPDEKDLPCTEEAPIKPIAPYGVSKATVERYLFSRHATHGLNYVALRYANVYGPRQSFGEAGVCAIFTHMLLKGERPTIFGDGTQGRDYVFVKDVVAANLLALDDRASGAYNVSTGVCTTTREVFDAVAAATGYNQEPIMAEERPGEVQRTYLSSDRLQSELGWRPSVTFKEGIKLTVAWMKKQK
jgi:UDP-glucose 4-epimerase